MTKPAFKSSLLPMLFLAGWSLLPIRAEATELSIFSDQLALAIDAPGPEQQARGYFGGGSISGLYPTTLPGHVLLITPPGDAVVGRRLHQALRSPLNLKWTWRRLPPDTPIVETLTDDAPMRLIVGFEGGTAHHATAAPSLIPPAEASNSRIAGTLPPYDRALVITWDNQYWESGVTDRQGNLARFIAHGGPADGSWWKQSVDLADLHARLWPSIRLNEVHVAWVAVALRKSDGRSLGEIAGLALGD